VIQLRYTPARPRPRRVRHRRRMERPPRRPSAGRSHQFARIPLLGVDEVGYIPSNPKLRIELPTDPLPLRPRGPDRHLQQGVRPLRRDRRRRRRRRRDRPPRSPGRSIPALQRGEIDIAVAQAYDDRFPPGATKRMRTPRHPRGPHPHCRPRHGRR
jgi:hypothetical protein